MGVYIAACQTADHYRFYRLRENRTVPVGLYGFLLIIQYVIITVENGIAFSDFLQYNNKQILIL